MVAQSQARWKVLGRTCASSKQLAGVVGELIARRCLLTSFSEGNWTVPLRYSPRVLGKSPKHFTNYFLYN